MQKTNIPQLPIDARAADIAAAVDGHPVTFLVAPTGVGKSIRVPQILRRAGYDMIIVTEPSKVATSSIAARTAAEMGTEVGQLVGCKHADEYRVSDETRILYCTDGYIEWIIQEIANHPALRYVLMIDEIHQWNRNQEGLLAWVKDTQAKFPNLRVVVASATFDAEPLAEFFDDAAVITLEEQTYPVEWVHSDEEMATVIHELAEHATSGEGVLAFLTGKGDIEDLDAELRALGTDQHAVILHLHGDMTFAEQQRVFRQYASTMIVLATNAAQTGLTMPGIKYVVDGGKAKCMIARSGVENLDTIGISKADCKQRAGRAGRTQAGTYYLCSRRPYNGRPDFPTPEILRSLLDQLYLRFKAMGLDAATLPFFHQPEQQAFLDARDVLVRLGALDNTGAVTAIGRAMSRLPLDVRLARTFVEAENLDVTDQVATIVACLQAGGIRVKPPKGSEPAWRSLTDEKVSDLLAELDCYVTATHMHGHDERRRKGIHIKRFHAARDLRDRLARDLRIREEPVECDDPNTRETVLLACLAGLVDRVFEHDHRRDYRDPKSGIWQLDVNSVVRHADWIVGLPIILTNERADAFGDEFRTTTRLVCHATSVSIGQLTRLAPHLITEEPDALCYDPRAGEVVFRHRELYCGHHIGDTDRPAPAGPESTKVLAEALARGDVPHSHAAHNQEVISRVNTVARRYPDRVRRLYQTQLTELFVERLGSCYRVADLVGVDLRLELSDFVPEDLQDVVNDLEPETIEVDGISFLVTYVASSDSYVTAIVQLTLEQLRRAERLPALSKADYVSSVQVVDASGAVVNSGRSLHQVKYQVEDAERRSHEQQTRARLQAQIEEHALECDALAERGRDTARLRELLGQARVQVRGLYEWGSVTLEGVHATLVTIASEITYLNGDPAELLVEGLMSGRTTHPDVAHNQRVITELDTLVIRSGGFIEPLTPEMLRRHYEERLDGATRISDVRLLDLRLHLHDYAPPEIVADLDLAPLTVELQGRKGNNSYNITYQYEEVDGVRVPTAHITVPRSVYERNCAQHGRESGFPELPEGVRLIIAVTESGNTIARGEDGEQLQHRLKQKGKGKRRGANTPSTDSSGLFKRTAPIEAAPLPPWHRGR